MKTVAILLDTFNLRTNVRAKFEKRIDYQQLLLKISGEDMLFRHIAYGSTQEDRPAAFEKHLKHLGFEVKFRKAIMGVDHDNKDKMVPRRWIDPYVDLTLDLVDILASGKVDRVVLCSSQPEYASLGARIKQSGASFEVWSSRIPNVLKNAADKCFEISEDLLLNEVEQTAT